MSHKNEPLTFTKSHIRVLSFLFFLEKRSRRRKMKLTSVSRTKKFSFTHKQHLQWSSIASSSLRSWIFYSSSYLSRTFPCFFHSSSCVQLPISQLLLCGSISPLLHLHGRYTLSWLFLFCLSFVWLPRTKEFSFV